MIKIPIAEPDLSNEELKNVIDAVKSGWISSQGEYVSKFEREFAEYCGAKYGISTFNGTTALHLALKAIGVENGDEVIVPDLTFIATANTVKYCNAKPVFVDSHPEYWCMDPEEIEKRITKKTKAIIPVHLYGHPCDMDAIIDIARNHDIYVIEDAAEAHGAEYKGKRVGSMGDIGCFSFYGNKIVTTGEGGMCTTNNEELAEKMNLLKNHGMDPERRYWYNTIGYNYRMTNLQAAVGVAQLNKIEKFIEIKRKNAELYNSLLEGIDGMTPPPEMPWAKNVYWMYSVLIDEEKFGIDRDKLMKELEKEGIETRPFFYPMHTLPPHLRNEKYPVAEFLSKRGINLPSAVTLKREEVEYICQKIKEKRVKKL